MIGPGSPQPWAAALAVALTVAALAGCQSTPDDSTSTEVPAPVVDTRPKVRFGVISSHNPVIMYRTYQPMMDFLSENSAYRFELQLGRTYEDAVRFLGSGRVDLAILGGLSYLEARKQYGARPLVRPLNAAGTPTYHSVFITRDDSPLSELEDLAGRSLALASFHSTAGNLIPRYELDRAGVPMHRVARIENLPHHELVVQGVLKGHFDAGAVKEEVARQYAAKGLRVLHVSEPIPSGPIVCRAQLPDSVAEQVAEALLRLDPENPQHRRWMQLWDEAFRHGFIRARDEDYDGLRKILNSAPEGCGRGCHPAIQL